MKKIPFTKIVATLGPASQNEAMIELLMQAGVNVFRLNMSHGKIEDHIKTINSIRVLEKKLQKTIGILCDLQGPKLRIGCFEEGMVSLKAGQKFILDSNPKLGDETRVELPHPEIFSSFEKSGTVVLNDGALSLQINEVHKDFIETTILNDALLSNHKGFNLPNKVLPLKSLTAKDLKDLEVLLHQDIDFIGLSFVQSPQDVQEALDLTKGKVRIIAKIEKPSAVQELDKILELADGIMIARGDLGVECPLEEVPLLQRKIIKLCREKGKPVIVATQMLESMIDHPLPTRAEVSDIATAVFAGTDAVMLSGETAIGKYPVNAVRMMQKTILKTESDSSYEELIALHFKPTKSISEAICGSLRDILKHLKNPKAIVSFSVSGGTVLRTSRERPLFPILSLVENEQVARFLCLVWGTIPEICVPPQKMEEMDSRAMEFAEKHHFLETDGELVITAGFPFEGKGKTNLIHITKMP
ncbi:MAG: pyruvate kinase [Alphaproteobacteria bacterium]|nr:pyruvate kinase [Alphaproteobacteria bacterium]